MKLLVNNPKGFEIRKWHSERIRSVAEIEIEIAGNNEEFYSHLPSADILMCNNSNFKKAWLEKASNLKWVHAMAAGVDKILPDLPENILLSNSRGVHSINIAEHVLGCMIMHERRLDLCLKAQLKKDWILKGLQLNPPGELHGKTALIIGLGKIGSRLAKVLSCIGMNVIGIRSDVSKKSEFVKEIHPIAELKNQLQKADYAIVALPYTKKTCHLLGETEFAFMKKTAFFINIGRGSIVDEQALIKALKEKKISGAALDVFEKEPLPESSELWGMDNVIVTPHSAGITPFYMERVVAIFCDNLKAFIEGGRLPTLVDPKKEY